MSKRKTIGWEWTCDKCHETEKNFQEYTPPEYWESKYDKDFCKRCVMYGVLDGDIAINVKYFSTNKNTQDTIIHEAFSFSDDTWDEAVNLVLVRVLNAHQQGEVPDEKIKKYKDEIKECMTRSMQFPHRATTTMLGVSNLLVTLSVKMEIKDE